jgi:uncharacterized protein (DUF58 family)
MIFPTQRLLWVVALLIVPLCTALSFVPNLMLVWLCLAMLFIICLALWDARQGHSADCEISAPTSLKAFKNRALQFVLHVKTEEGNRGHLQLPELGVEAAFEGAGDLPLSFTPAKRGFIRLSKCAVISHSPWGLWRVVSTKKLNTEIRVHPDLTRNPTAKLLLAARIGGTRIERLAGRGREFERLREYVSGDSYDEIYWKATARRNKPVVRIFQMERTQDIYAILDSSRLSARHDAAEEYVNAALILALAVENLGDNFGIVTFSDRVHRFLPAMRGREHFARCRDAVYDLEAQRVAPDFAELFTFLQTQIRRRSLLLFLTDLTDPIVGETFVREGPLLARRHVVAISRLSSQEDGPVFTTALPDSVDDISRKLANHIHWGRQRDLAKQLQHSGIRVLCLRADSAAKDLVEHYREIKERQIL